AVRIATVLAVAARARLWRQQRGEIEAIVRTVAAAVALRRRRRAPWWRRRWWRRRGPRQSLLRHSGLDEGFFTPFMQIDFVVAADTLAAVRRIEMALGTDVRFCRRHSWGRQEWNRWG